MTQTDQRIGLEPVVKLRVTYLELEQLRLGSLVTELGSLHALLAVARLSLPFTGPTADSEQYSASETETEWVLSTQLIDTSATIRSLNYNSPLDLVLAFSAGASAVMGVAYQAVALVDSYQRARLRRSDVSTRIAANKTLREALAEGRPGVERLSTDAELPPPVQAGVNRATLALQVISAIELQPPIEPKG